MTNAEAIRAAAAAGEQPWASYIEEIKRQGVRDEDFDQWWNLPADERASVAQDDEETRLALYITAQERTGTSEGAAQELWKHHPRFYDPISDEITGSDDDPIPIELKDRINIWLLKADESELNEKVDHSSTFNALVREELRAGNL